MRGRRSPGSECCQVADVATLPWGELTQEVCRNGLIVIVAVLIPSDVDLPSHPSPASHTPADLAKAFSALDRNLHFGKRYHQIVADGWPRC